MQIRKDRQTLLWSATWPDEVAAIAKEFLTNPYKVSLQPNESCLTLLQEYESPVVHCP